MKLSNKKTYIVCLMIAFYVSMTLLILNISVVNASPVINGRSVNSQFSFDFTDYTLDGSDVSGNAYNWTDHVYSYDGVHLSQGSLRALGAGNGNEIYDGNSEKHTGEVVYRVVATEVSDEKEKIFDELVIHISGRIFCYFNDKLDECYMKISVGKSADSYEVVSDIKSTSDGATTVRKFDLTEYVKGSSGFFLKIQLCGFENDWVCMEKLNITGKTVYKDAIPVQINIPDSEENILVSCGDKVLLKKANATNGDKNFEVSTKVLYSDNSQMEITENSFIPDKTGEYTVIYEVDDDGRKYSDSYKIYCVPNKTANGYVTGKYGEFEKYNFLNVNNYVAEKDAVIEKTADNKLKLSGKGGYVLPLNWGRGFNIVFDITSLNQGAIIEFAFTGKSGLVNFDTKTEKGLYYTIKKGGTNLIVSGIYQSGEEIKDLGLTGINKIKGTHGLGINRRDTTFLDGVSAYFDGQEIFSYQHCMFVELSKFLSNNNFYFSFSCAESEIEVDNIKQGDILNPSLCDAKTNEPIYNRDYPKKGIVSEYFILPDVVMYDEYDGNMPFDVIITDPYGNNVTLEHSSDNDRFFVEYEGRYDIKYNSSDYSGNKGLEIKHVVMTLSEYAPQMIFKNKIPSSARKGQEITLYAPDIKINGKIKNELQENIEISITDFNGNTKYKKAGEIFVPAYPEDYEIKYKISHFTEITENEETKIKEYVTSAYFKVAVKLNVDPSDSFKDILKKENWVNNSDNVMTQEENGLNLYGRTVSYLPFDMENGIEITVDLKNLENKSVIDNWFSIGIGHKALAGHFDDQREGFVYFMLYFEDGHYYVNSAFNMQDGRRGGLFGPIDLGTNSVVTLSMEKLYGNSSKNDNINLYLNHIKTAYGTEGLVSYSQITDDENFVYLAVDAYGSFPGKEAKDFKSAKIISVTKCDQKSPVFKIDGEIPEEVVVGDKIIVPEITVSDNLDKDLRYLIGIYDPDGNEISLADGSFTAEKVGTYNIVLKAKDKSGNYTDIVRSIKVNEKRNVTLIVVISVSVAVVVGLTIFSVVICIKNKKMKKEKTK